MYSPVPRMPRRPGARDRCAPDDPADAVVAWEPRRLGWVIAADWGQLVRREEPFVQWKAAAFARWHEPDDARVSCPGSV